MVNKIDINRFLFTPLLIWIFSIVVAIMLFLHGIASFSKNVMRLGGERLREIICKLTRTDLNSALVNGFCTALAPLANEHCRQSPNGIGAYFIQPSSLSDLKNRSENLAVREQILPIFCSNVILLIKKLVKYGPHRRICSRFTLAPSYSYCHAADSSACLVSIESLAKSRNMK